ncbi:Smr/MutS family protein [Terrarubrum flagellatum]|uniref:Smr/MutS family protein n=1 Tax=Terrirubrum flagellatum TaxID=2895980 RepID=UPI003145213B
MKRRTLTREEKSLWAHVQRSVQPMPGRARDDIPIETPAQAAATFATALAPAKVSPPPQPLPLAPIERKLLRKVKRGARDIDGVLDLHGLTQAAAHDALNSFLHRKQREGASLVIIVTGKGALGSYDDPDRERGVLRRVVPHWLRMADLRSLVLGFETAAAHHGGAGALYVRLRRARHLFDG